MLANEVADVLQRSDGNQRHFAGLRRMVSARKSPPGSRRPRSREVFGPGELIVDAIGRHRGGLAADGDGHVGAPQPVEELARHLARCGVSASVTVTPSSSNDELFNA